MSRRRFVSLYRVFFAVLVLMAVIIQFVHGARQPNFSVTNYFSFFTIESNIFAAVVLLVAVVKQPKSSSFAYVRGAATLYMVVTGIVYSALLAGADVQTPIPWINTVLHYIFPVVMLLDWVIDRSKKLSYKTALYWLIFPFAYLAYSLVRGPFAHWYPYPFLNVAKHGYASVAVTSVVVAIAFVVVAGAVAGIPRLRRL